MIVADTFCPPIESLARLGSDSLPAAEFAAIESHVQVCVRCQETLDRLSAQMTDPEDAAPSIPGFVIERELGRGGMGVVYQAWQPELARRVAVKVLVRGPANKKRWLREARAMGQVRHPHIVRLHQVGEASFGLYLVMDLIAGGSLKERMTGPISPRRAASWIEIVARAVAVIHTAGMLHLDIKPSNILLDVPPGGSLDEAVPILADFGLARIVDDASETFSARSGASIVPRGTPAFMAPEQVESRHTLFGPHTDVFALGCTLYALLTGLSPFQAASVVETLDLVRTRDPVPPRTLVPGVSRDLETIVLRCLHKEMRARYGSAIELADDLRRWLLGLPIKARPIGWAGRSRHWCVRHPAVAALLVALAITVTASLAALAGLWRHAESERHRAESALALAVTSQAVATRARGDLIDLLGGTVPEYRLLTPERTAEVLKIVAAQTKRLCDVDGLAVTEVTAIASLVLQHGQILNFSDQTAEAQAILDDALRLVEKYDKPGIYDRDLVIQHHRILTTIARDSWKLGKADRAIELLERAAAVGRKTGDDEICLDALIYVFRETQNIVEQSLAADDLGSKDRILTHYRKMAEMTADKYRHSSLIQLFLTLTRPQALADHADPVHQSRREEWSHAFAPVRALDREKKPFQRTVAIGMAYAVNLDALFAAVAGPEPPEQTATRILATVDEWTSEYVSSPRGTPDTANLLFLRLQRICTVLRHNRKYDRAENAAHALEILSRRLCARDPTQPTYRVMLSGALEQNSKNAWSRDDRPLAELSLRRALDEAKRALRLSPDDSHVQATVIWLQNKLAGLEVGSK